MSPHRDSHDALALGLLVELDHLCDGLNLAERDLGEPTVRRVFSAHPDPLTDPALLVRALEDADGEVFTHRATGEHRPPLGVFDSVEALAAFLHQLPEPCPN